ncbi:MAG TPA: universal stress protein [Pyrodictium sp.]|nr:universal stress protein [Pyrodictium sp.]
MVYKNILVGYDGSEASRKAVEKATKIAKIFGAKLILVTVIPSPVPLVGELLVPSTAKSTEAVETAKRELEKMARELSEIHEINVEYQVLQGDPAEELTRYAEEKGCDLIVVGRRGAGKLERLLLGSVSEKVIRLAKKADVLVVETRKL